ncbi:MAG: histidine kinase [Balneolaceae bacterium]
MTQPISYSSIETPKNFLKMLVGFWVFLTLTLGLTSTRIFNDLMPPDTETFKGDGFLFAGIYAFLFLFIFGVTWKPLLKYFPLQKPRMLVFHALAQVVNSILGFGLGFILTGALHAFIYDQAEMDTSKSELGLSIIALISLVGILMTNGFFYASAYMRRSVEADKRRVDSELSALRAQINPHFLFNSLNSIAALIRISPKEAEAVTEDLADVFRYTLRASDHPSATLKEELEIVQLYLNIEKARFKERLTVQLNVPKELHSIQIPVLTLQPLIENSIKHGVSKKEGNHIVSLNINLKNKALEIRVSDTGPGFAHHNFSKLLEQGTGLSNVFQRLKLNFGDEVDGAISNEGLILRFPLDEKEIKTIQPAAL